MSANVSTQSAQEIALHCGAVLRGNGATRVRGISSIESANDGDVVFAADDVRLRQALESRASLVLTGQFAANEQTAKPLLIASDPKLAFARIAALFSDTERRVGHDESAQIHLSAKIGEETWIGPGVVVEGGVSIGNRTSIEANSVVGANVVIGEECQIGPNVTIYSGTRVGNRVVVQAGTVLGSTGFGYARDDAGRYHLFPQVGRLIIEDDVEIGANCTVDRGALDATIIRRGTKLDNMVHVGHNVEIGEDVVIAAQTGVSGSSRIGPGAIVGGQVGIADHVEIEGGVILGAQSGIPSKKVIRGKGVVFWGTPARPIKDYLKELATLARLTRKKKE
jgi:UDP-3-O-[3-hydroxymyristoyl] glucosamine N-acyltransferase